MHETFRQAVRYIDDRWREYVHMYFHKHFSPGHSQLEMVNWEAFGDGRGYF